jgi:tRNA (pseudouridine54-N1)-methyltransferase
MRRFVVVGHNVNADGDFTLNDLCGGAGRLDVLLRCVSSAFFLSHGLRREVELYLHFPGQGGFQGLPPNGPKTVRLVGRELRYLNPDERSTGALVRTALLKRLDGEEERQSTPGIHVSRRGFDLLVRSLPGPVLLAEDGAPWPPGGLPEESTFYLSDHHDFTASELGALARAGALRTSLGETCLHSHHCITVAHWLMDRATKPL